MKQSTAIFVGLFVFRIINAHLIKTFFQPDEYFQALEPAWQIAFGPQSGAWITWEWKERLRTSIHPYLFATVYQAMDWLCKYLQTDHRVRADALGAAPRLLQAFSAASMDFLTWRFAGRLYGSQYAATWAALAVTILSPWQWYCSTRTFSNSLEATLTAVALYCFPWRWFLTAEIGGDAEHAAHHEAFVLEVRASLHFSLCVAAIAFYLRPTNIIIWVAISVALVWQNRSFHKAQRLFLAAVAMGLNALVACGAADRLYYGDWSIPPVRFLYLNLVQDLATFYGQNRIDYYFTEGLPLLLTTALPFALLGLCQSLRTGKEQQSPSQALEQATRSVLGAAVGVTVLAFSAIKHKEMRFIYPLLPILHVLAAKPLAAFFAPLGKNKFRSAILVCGFAANLFIAYYVSTVHQRGVIDVMRYLRHQQEGWFDAAATGDLSETVPTNISVGFLMPCHSTPWRSHFLYPEIEAWALTCEPPINLSAQERLTYLDEADVFYADPAAWLDHNMENRKSISVEIDEENHQHIDHATTGRRKWPYYLVSFEQLLPTLQPLLQGTKYKECKRFFNTHWHDDKRRKGDVVVYCMRR